MTLLTASQSVTKATMQKLEASHGAPRHDGGDLSVVFCGPFETAQSDFPGTLESAQRVRALLPQAELLLATWEGQPLEADFGGTFDRVLLLKDPGITVIRRLSGSEFKVNYRRLVFAALEGARAAKREWLWRLRCDCHVEHAEALNFYTKEAKNFEQNPWSVFRSPVLIPSLYTRNARRGGAIFHASDLMHLGRSEDLVNLFSAGVNGPFYKNFLGVGDGGELFPEQMLWLSALYEFRSGETRWEAWNAACRGTAAGRPGRSLNPSAVIASDLSFLGNFLVGDFAQLGLSFKKDFASQGWSRNCYKPSEFARTREEYGRRPNLYHAKLLTRSSLAYLCNFWHSRVAPLLFDWSPSARSYKLGLLRGVIDRFFRKNVSVA